MGRPCATKNLAMLKKRSGGGPTIAHTNVILKQQLQVAVRPWWPDLYTDYFRLRSSLGGPTFTQNNDMFKATIAVRLWRPDPLHNIIRLFCDC